MQSHKTDKIIFIFIFTVCLLIYPVISMASKIIKPDSVVKGGVFKISVEAKSNQISGLFMDKKIVFYLDEKKPGYYSAVAGIDLNVKPGSYPFQLIINKQKQDIFITVVDKDYGEESFTIPASMEPGQKKMKRVRDEQKIFRRLWQLPPGPKAFKGAFILPIKGDIISTFGKRRIINGQPRNPHSGVDLRAKEGTPVKASNCATTVLTGNFYFGGKTVVLDHGLGIYSVYMHLSKIIVKKGDMVKKGDVVGLSGATGRATGPHLHWGIRLTGARINPFDLIGLYKN